MGMKELIEEKRAWRKVYRAHKARVKALPRDYQIVYAEIQNYLYKVAPFVLSDMINGTGLFADLLDLFEEGAASGKGVLEVTGSDVAAFCDELIASTSGSKTSAHQ